MSTDSVAVLKLRRRAGPADLEGLPAPARLGAATGRQGHLPPGRRQPPRHDPQGAGHPAGQGISRPIRILGNIGTVSLPLTAALAEEREFLRPGDRVGFLGIGSGLNCLMLGVEW